MLLQSWRRKVRVLCVCLLLLGYNRNAEDKIVLLFFLTPLSVLWVLAPPLSILLGLGSFPYDSTGFGSSPFRFYLVLAPLSSMLIDSASSPFDFPGS